jgi:hypothetical protein
VWERPRTLPDSAGTTSKPQRHSTMERSAILSLDIIPNSERICRQNIRYSGNVQEIEDTTDEWSLKSRRKVITRSWTSTFTRAMRVSCKSSLESSRRTLNSMEAPLGREHLFENKVKQRHWAGWLNDGPHTSQLLCKSQSGGELRN